MGRLCWLGQLEDGQRGEQMLRDSLEPETQTGRRLKVKGDKITHN